MRRYWALDPNRRIRMGTDRDHTDAFVDLLKEAVRCRLRTSARVGVTLSGGLDSSSVAVVAARLLGGRQETLPAFAGIPLKEFRVVPPRGKIYDESPFMEAAVAESHQSIELRPLEARGLNFLTEAQEFMWQTCHPIRNPGYQPWIIAMTREARNSGIRTLLTGHRGNLFLSQGGHGRLFELAASGRWASLYAEVAAYARRRGYSFWEVLRSRVLFHFAPAALLLWSGRLQHRNPERWHGFFPSNPTFLREVQVLKRAKAAGHDPYGREPRAWREGAARSFQMLGNDLSSQETGLRLGSGMDLPDPTADARLIQFCLGLSSDQFLRHGESRSLIRRAMKGRLPDKVRFRTLHGSQGVDLALRMEPLREEAGELLGQIGKSARARRYLDLPRLERLYDIWAERARSRPSTRFFGEQLLLARGILMGSFLRCLAARLGGQTSPSGMK